MEIKWILMPPHHLTIFEIKMHYESEPRFNGVFSRDNMPKTIKDGVYIINLDEYADVGTHWIALFCNRSEILAILVLNIFLKKLNKLLGIKK